MNYTGIRKSKALLFLAVPAVTLVFLFSGCGAPQEGLDRVTAELEAAKEQVTDLVSQIGDADAELQAAQARIIELENQVAELTGESVLTGATPADTAANIVERYFETHSYSTADFFICADMALDVWNMLKAQGINALIKIGNVEEAVLNVAKADHAWVLAETSPGQYLALEVTGGYTVPKADNPLYYAGWSFNSPREYKKFLELRQQYNAKITFINQISGKSEIAYGAYSKEFDKYQELIDEFNEKYAGQPMTPEAETLNEEINAQLEIMKELEGRYNQLSELADEQQQQLNGMVTEMASLTS